MIPRAEISFHKLGRLPQTRDRYWRTDGSLTLCTEAQMNGIYAASYHFIP
jgi:hypothetical protein